MKPLGWWKCTKSTFKDFVVGQVYECREDRTGSPRIYPHGYSCWAPYWQDHGQKFCYPKSQLDFTYLGSSRPQEKREVERIVIFFTDGSAEELKK